MNDRGVVLSLALDAVDPRLDEERRAVSAATALDTDDVLAAAVWSALSFTVLQGVYDRFGPDAIDGIMRDLAVTMMRIAEVDPR